MGLMPDRVQPRARLLQEIDLLARRAAVDQFGELQRDFLLLSLYKGLCRNECGTYAGESDRPRGGHPERS